MEKNLNKADEHGREQIDTFVLQTAVLEAAQTVRARYEATARRTLLKQALVDPAVARWMPPYKYRRLSVGS
jgi:hypothetical protein